MITNRLTNIIYGQQSENEPDLYGQTTLEPFWAAGCNVSTEHFVVQKT